MPNATYENQLFAIICEINSGEIMAITNRLNDKVSLHSRKTFIHNE